MNLVYIVLIISAAFNIFLFLYFNWYVKKRTSSASLFLELKEHQKEVNQSIVEINAVTDRNLLLVEEKIKELKEILDDTDKRISVYVKELDKSRKGEEMYLQLGKGIRAALKTEPAQNTPQLSVVRPDIEVPVQNILPIETASAVTSQPPVQTPPAAPRKSEAFEKPVSKRQIRAHIDLLVNEGLPPEKIASQLGISIAEVDLAMQLRRR